MDKGKAPIWGTPPTEASSELLTRQDRNIGVRPETTFGDGNPGAIGRLPSFLELCAGAPADYRAARFEEPSILSAPRWNQTFPKRPRPVRIFKNLKVWLRFKIDEMECDLEESFKAETQNYFWIITWDQIRYGVGRDVHSGQGWTMCRELAIKCHNERWEVESFKSSSREFSEHMGVLREFCDTFPTAFGKWDPKLNDERRDMSFNMFSKFQEMAWDASVIDPPSNLMKTDLSPEVQYLKSWNLLQEEPWK